MTSLPDYAFLLSIIGKQQKRIFESEIHKKLFLDAAASEAGSGRIVGYCVLDDQAHMMIGTEEQTEVEGMAFRMMKAYGDQLVLQSYPHVQGWSSVMTAYKREEVWDKVMELHHLPVKEDYTIWPEHYWWSSYQEYLGRRWMPFQISGCQKSIREIKKDHREWKKRHPEILKKTDM